METETKGHTVADVINLMARYPRPMPSAAEVLASTSTEGLLTAAYQLTHRLNTCGRRAAHAAHGMCVGVTERTRDLRQQRDLITAELLRRAGA